jgi:hypothetical protein
VRIDRKKNHTHAVLSRRRKRKSQARSLALKKSMGNLNQYPRSIASLRIASASSSMSQVDQNLHAFEHNIVRLSSLNIRDESYAASIVLVLGPVQPLSRW